MIVDVVIPALNEEASIGLVLRDIDRSLVRHVVVVDNRSSDQTAQLAGEAGATVLSEPRRGYGAACLKGIDWCSLQVPPPDVIVFMDADYSDYASDLPMILQPVRNGFHLVIGSRTLGQKEKGSMTTPQVFGNWLATHMIYLLFGHRFTDLGPFRAITFPQLQHLGMRDTNYGWTAEMQVKAVKQKLKCTEVPVRYRKRIGTSKVSGTVKGTIMAGYKIITTILRYSR